MCINDYKELAEVITRDVSIIEYIKRNYPEIKLRHAGKRETGLCPLVSETNGSFNLYSDSNRFHCYSCNQGGSLIDFVMKYDKVDFKEACKKIAANENINFEINVNHKHEAFKNKTNDTCLFYEKKLFNNDEALNYITSRGISEETIKKFRLGYVPKNSITANTNSKFLNCIKGRISFPFLEIGNDNTSRCLGMAYRGIKDGIEPKYINDANHSDSNSELYGVFNKGSLLFGYNQARDSIKKVDSAIVVEGYFDVLSLHEAKLTNTVGICGTAFTEKQADLLIKLTKNLFFFLDGDKAGIGNMLRILPMLLSKGFNVKFVKAEKCGDDPADICKELNFDTLKIRNYISANSTIAMIDVIDDKVKYLNKLIVNQQTIILNEMEEIFSNISNKNDKLVYKDYLLKRIGLK